MDLVQADPWLLNLIRARPSRRPVPGGNGAEDFSVPEGHRDMWLTSMAGSMRRRGFSPEAILAALEIENDARCVPQKDSIDLRRIAYSVGRYAPGDPIRPDDAKVEQPDRPADRVDAWPAFPLDASNKALHGLAGDIVRGLDPYTEADPAAILTHFLVFFGNSLGTAPHFRIGGDRHPAKLFAVLVGDTSAGRKGTAEGQVRYLFEAVDVGWTRRSIRHGLASGEALVRYFDPVDAGGHPEEPRLTIVEKELVNVLQAMSRDGSTLSGTIRNAWDHEDLSIMRSTKKNTLRVTGTHVSIVGHITPGELVRRLDASQTSNGFANRFLWVVVRRSKQLPDAPPVPQPIADALAKDTSAAQSFGTETREMGRDTAAADLWRSLYPSLIASRGGLAGLVTSRAEAQIGRLALIYAILDRSRLVCAPHLEAAKAFFDFTVASAERIFGDRLGNPLAQRILDFLRSTDDAELSRGELYDALGRNYSGREIDAAIAVLEEAGYGRRAERAKPQGVRGPKIQTLRLVPGR